MDRGLCFSDDRLSEDTYPNVCSTMRVRLRSPGVKNNSYGPQLGYDGQPYSRERERARLEHLGRWQKRAEQLVAKALEGPSVGVTYLIDWNNTRCSCVKNAKNVRPHNEHRLAALGLISPHPDTPPADRIVTATLEIDMGNGEVLIVDNVEYCPLFTDNVLVAAHLNATTNWSVTHEGIISPLGTTFRVEPFKKEHAIGIIVNQRQSLPVRCLDI